MLRLVYISAHAGKDPAADVADILAQSRRNNAAQNVGGVLVFHDGSFFQVLEGPGVAVTATLARIRRDPRHRHVTELLREPCTTRAFADWRMGFVRVGDMPPEGREAMLSALDLAHDLGTGGPGNQRLHLLLRSFLRSFRSVDLPRAMPG